MQIKSCQRVCKFGYMKLVKPIILTALASALVSCDNFEYHPYSVHIDGETAVNVKYTSILENSGLTPPFKFAFITEQIKQASANLKKNIGTIHQKRR